MIPLENRYVKDVFQNTKGNPVLMLFYEKSGDQNPIRELQMASTELKSHQNLKISAAEARNTHTHTVRSFLGLDSFENLPILCIF